ncbi:MAG: cell division protein ZipA C-terminal FtsZ-binding domain-containing protein [Zoogloeaceae bacterium]|jgi:hypothetical protein|nr:cell division protein ZipA C-terminal FtsZ-binding domain-containing protein [Zoogloeaceae bacterium]
MNATETGIALLGAIVILGVIAYNKWQERKHRKTLEAGFRHAARPADDVLLADGGRREPGMPPFPQDAQEAPGGGGQNPVEEPENAEEGTLAAVETMLRDTEEVGQEAPRKTDAGEVSFRTKTTVTESAAGGYHLSPIIDLISEFAAETPLALSAFKRECAEVLLPFGRRLNWEGKNEADDQWDFYSGPLPDADKRYSALRAGLQLVNRRGVVAQEEISLFLAVFPRIAEKFNLQCHFSQSNVNAIVTQAEQLDAFCSGLDVVLYLSVVSNGKPFPGTQIRALAEAENMTLEDGGIYTQWDENGVPLYRLWNTDVANPFSLEGMKRLYASGLTFQFDVPCIPRGQQVYLQMLTAIRRFTKVLNGTLIDDQGKPLADDALERLRQEYVIRPQEHMAHEGMLAGSALARRLFS